MQQPGTALVTGGARRIGRAIVEDLCAHGFSVIIHCNHSERDAAQLVSTIRHNGGRADFAKADLTDMAAVENLVATATALAGPIDLLVNNASLFEPDTADDFNWRVWDQHFALHVKAPVLLTRRFAEALPTGREGLVVNIVDQRVWKPTPRFFSYALSKSALWNATRIMAQTFAPRIRVNAIGPGPSLASVQQSAEDFRAQAGSVLLGQGPSLGEFGSTIRYLWQARSVTGQLLALDGGQHLAWETPDATGQE